AARGHGRAGAAARDKVSGGQSSASPVLRDACSPDEAKRNPGLAFQKANPPLGLHNRRRSLHPGYVLLSKDAAFPQLLQVPCRSEARLTSSPSRSSSSRAPTS